VVKASPDYIDYRYCTYRIPSIVPHEFKVDSVVEVNGDLPVCQLRLIQLKVIARPRRRTRPVRTLRPGEVEDAGEEIIKHAFPGPFRVRPVSAIGIHLVDCLWRLTQSVDSPVVAATWVSIRAGDWLESARIGAHNAGHPGRDFLMPKLCRKTVEHPPVQLF
jgi:hypothetical protein